MADYDGEQLLYVLFRVSAPKIWTLLIFTSANSKHSLLSDVILRRTTFSQHYPAAYSGAYNAP